MPQSSPTTAVTVYCASSYGHRAAFQNAAVSLGKALARTGRPLVYGGGRKGIMGVVSGAVIEAGGHVTGVIPYAMVAAGGEREQTEGEVQAKIAAGILFDGQNRKNENTVVVDSMHERKLEMAKRSCGFIALPGGFGTFEELLEVTTWSQLGIHNRPVIVLNVLSFYEPLRELIRNGIREGFIAAQNEALIIFVDGPQDQSSHDDFDWGQAALDALDRWQDTRNPSLLYDWTKREAGDAAKGEEIEAA